MRNRFLYGCRPPRSMSSMTLSEQSYPLPRKAGSLPACDLHSPSRMGTIEYSPKPHTRFKSGLQHGWRNRHSCRIFHLARSKFFKISKNPHFHAEGGSFQAKPFSIIPHRKSTPVRYFRRRCECSDQCAPRVFPAAAVVFFYTTRRYMISSGTGHPTTRPGVFCWAFEA